MEPGPEVDLLLTALELLASFQPPPAPAAGGGGGGGASGGFDGILGLWPILIMFVAVYFLMIRPQQKRQREMDTMLKALQKGQVVRTTGGIRGEITDLNEREVTLLVAEKTRINVLRSHIAGLEQADAAQAKS